MTQAHIADLLRLYDLQRQRIAAKVERCPREYRDLAAEVCRHLRKVAPRMRPTTAGLSPLIKPRAGLIWVRYRTHDNTALWRITQARLGHRPPARNTQIPRRTPTPSRARLEPTTVYDWPWTRDDFRRPPAGAQWWEASLAADYEAAVTGPLRRAERAVRIAAKLASELVPPSSIQLDAFEAECQTRARLGLPPVRRDIWPASAELNPVNVPCRPVAIGADDLLARQRLLAVLHDAYDRRMEACTQEYLRAAAALRDRLDPDRRSGLRGPMLAPVVRDASFGDRIAVWQVTGQPRGAHEPAPMSAADLPWSSRTARSAYKHYVATRNGAGQPAVPAQEFHWLAEAPRTLRDFAAADRWERSFARYYDATVLAVLRRLSLVSTWCFQLDRYFVDPDRHVLIPNLQSYLAVC